MAYLFEPDAATFLQLRDYYKSNNRVQLHNFALAGTTGVRSLRLFPMGFENTIRAYKKNQADAMEYTYDISVQSATFLCRQQREAISSGLCNVTSLPPSKNEENRTKCTTYTVLSVDVEGADWEVFKAAHKTGCRWDLVILEGEGDANTTKEMGYEMVLHVAYNYVYHYRAEKDTAGKSADEIIRKARSK
jgi:FkbM family methyltransferase